VPTALEPQAQAELATSQLALPRSAVRQLAACAQGDELCPELELRDVVAVSLFAALGGSNAFGRGELRCAAFRASVIDRLAEHFFERHPDGMGVSIWPLLGTRAHRLPAYPWLDVDAPPVVALRQRYLPARASWAQRASCLCDAGRAATTPRSSAPQLFIVDDSVLPLCGEVMMRLLDSLCSHAAVGSELIVAHDAHAPLRPVPAGTGECLELQLASTEPSLARYPRFRVVDERIYGDELRFGLQGVKAIASLNPVAAASLTHLQLL
jgi:hypothetical protein